MFEKQSLREQFKLLLLPVMILSATLVGFITHHQYEKTLKIKSLEKDVSIVEEVRKIVTMIDKERDISLRYLLTDDKRAERMLQRELRKQRNINNTRVKSLQRKMLEFSNRKIEDTKYLKKIEENIEMFHESQRDVRERIDKRNAQSQYIINYYTALNSGFIDSITNSSNDIDFSILSKRILIYSLFLEYRDLLSQKDIYIKAIIEKNSVSELHRIELAKVKSRIETLKRISTNIVSTDIAEHHRRINQTKEMIEMFNIFNSLLVNNREILSELNIRKFEAISKKYQKRLKELDDHITRGMNIELNGLIEGHYNQVYTLALFFLISITAILIFTYRLYSYIREALFYGIIKMRSKIVRIVKDVEIIGEHSGSEKNEISQLLHLVDNFTINIKRSLNKTKRDFNEITILSTNLSQSSEKVVSHLQKQGQYLEEINFKLSIFLDTLQNSKFSFGNLKELLDDSSAKLNDLNLDVIYISYETLNLKDQSQQIVDNGEKCSNNNSTIIDILETQSSKNSDENTFTITEENYNKIISTVRENEETLEGQIALLKSNMDKLQKLSQVAVSIKSDAEKNNGNISELLAVVTTLSYETKIIAEEIKQTIEENQEFTESSKSMIQNSEYVYSDVTMLNKYVINLNMEFNKFRI